VLSQPEAPLLRALESGRSVLGLHGSRAVAVFDGYEGRAAAGDRVDEMKELTAAHTRKVARTIAAADDHGLDVVSFTAWVSQANALRCAMRAVPETALVFSIQEDTTLSPPIDMELIARMLLTDPSVYYVKFAWWDDCADEEGHLHHAYNPCTPHPATPLLHKIGEWSDRPSVATRAAYETKVWPLVQPTAKISPEQVCRPRPPAAEPEL
jgi:hypothetical protein